MAHQLRESFLALARTNEELESRVTQRTRELGEEKCPTSEGNSR